VAARGGDGRGGGPRRVRGPRRAAHRPAARCDAPSRAAGRERAHRRGAGGARGFRGGHRAPSRRAAARRRHGGHRRAVLPRHVAAAPVITLTDVHARYPRQSVDALDGVSLQAPRGSITAVVGPNGSGKSTLVRALLGRVAVASGRIAIDDADARTLAREAIARRVAVVTQREEAAFPMAVRDYV